MQKQLFKNSFIYSFSTFVQKSLVFIILPLYTQYLRPEEYGTISVVLAATYVAAIFFTLGLDAAILRFYYDNRYKETFKYFLGTLITAILALSIVNYTLIVTVFSPLLQQVYNNIPLYPYAYVSVGILVFQPVYNFCLSFLQAKGDAVNYTKLSFIFFSFNIALTLAFVVGLRMGAFGYLLALMMANVVGFTFGLWSLRRDFVFHFNLKYLKDALKYSFPFIPHSFISQVSGDADRFIINKFLNTSTVGIYQLGYSLSTPIDVLTNSIYRAFTPIFLKHVQSESAGDKAAIGQATLSISFLFLLCGFGLSIFSRDVIYWFFDEGFQNSHIVMPVLAYSFVMSGFYYLFSTMLFFDNKLTRFIPVCTLVSGVITIALDFLLIPLYGILGAAAAVFIGRFILAGLAFIFSRKNKTIEWPIGNIIFAFFGTLAISALTLLGNYHYQSAWWWLIIKLFIVLAAIIFLSFVMWRNGFAFFEKVKDVALSFRKR